MRAGKFERGTYNGMATRGSPSFTATIRQGEGETASLGTVSTSKRTFSTLVWPTDVIFADTNTTVTLTIANSASSSSDATSIGVIDDLEFVPAHEVCESFNAVVKSGDNFSADNWIFDNGRIDGDTKSSASRTDTLGSSVYFGHNRYRNNPSAAQLIDRGAMYQSVTFPVPGRYRLKWHARARADVRDAAFTANFPYGKKSALRVVLAEGGVTNTLFEGSTATTNFVGYECSFDIADASKTYILGFKGANDPSVSGATDQMSMISNVKCDRIGDAGQTEMNIDPNLSITVAPGAKLELDYVGTNEVASLRLAGRRMVGIVDAKSHPLYVSGHGALFVKPRGGFKVIFR